MGLRKFIDENTRLAYGAAAVLVTLSVLAIFGEASGNHGLPPGLSRKAYFTTEDQLTGEAAMDSLFIADVEDIPPFDHNGKPAYLAIVYSCNNGRVKWVNNLKRYTPDAKPRVEAYVASALAKGLKPPVDLSDFENGAEVKVSGPGPWIRANDPQANAVCAYKIPADASADDVTLCLP